MKLEVITAKEAQTKVSSAHGWGDKATMTSIDGEVEAIYFLVDDKPKFSLRIHSDGNLTLTTYRVYFKTDVPQNLYLETSHDWTKPEKKEKKGKTK